MWPSPLVSVGGCLPPETIHTGPCNVHGHDGELVLTQQHFIKDWTDRHGHTVAWLMSHTEFQLFCRHLVRLRYDNGHPAVDVAVGRRSGTSQQEGQLSIDCDFRLVAGDIGCPSALRDHRKLHRLAQRLLVRLWGPVVHLNSAFSVHAGIPFKESG